MVDPDPSEDMLAGLEEFLEAELRPYRTELPVYKRLPGKGISRVDILSQIRTMARREEPKWKDGFVSGAVYNGDSSHIGFLNEVYGLNSQLNPLHPDIWPSAIKYDAEVVAMTASLFGGGEGGLASVAGTISSGGTESIFLAMRAYRDWARSEKGIAEPQIVAPRSAHAAFLKAAQILDIEFVEVGLAPDFRVDPSALAAAVTDRTAVIVGSAPSFPHGLIDPIDELSQIAVDRGVGLHVDCCLGGFVVPFARRLGADVPPFDFTLPGVTSISADTHKFGYAAKGTSVILYRNRNLRRYQMFTTADWMGGLYYSPTIAGSRPGALSAEAWAAMLSFGEEGYMQATKAILGAGQVIKDGISSIESLRVLGNPLWVVAFTSDELDIYAVSDRMTARGWSLNGLQDPAAVHICVTLRHTQPGVAERFLADLEASVAEVRSSPGSVGVMTPIYGLAGNVATRGEVAEILFRYADVQFKV